jgi:hypothetical protein
LPAAPELVAFEPAPPDCGNTVLAPPRPVEFALALAPEVVAAPLGATDDVALIWEMMLSLKDPDMFSKLQRAP